MALASCAEDKAQGNAAYAAGDLELAARLYIAAIDSWEQALLAMSQPKTFEVGNRVRYSSLDFGRVMSAFTVFDEYFLKDFGTDQAIWVGEPGGDLRRFSARALTLVPDELWDLRFALAQNLAAVCLKRGDYREAVRWADAALAMDGKAPKALMRLGAALLRLGQPGPASDRLAAAAKLLPGDGEVKALLREAELKRSPTWVCVSGCCGPWGIVCGGAIVSTMPVVVPPAKKLTVEDSRTGSDAATESHELPGKQHGDARAQPPGDDTKQAVKSDLPDIRAAVKTEEEDARTPPSLSRACPRLSVLTLPALALLLAVAAQIGRNTSG